MSREFEIKLEIPESAVGKVMRLPWLWELASGELRASRLASTYYDTPTYALRERGITLRVRRAGSTCLQTIKAAVNGAALPIERNEWEEEIAGEEPELKRAAGTPLARIRRKKLQRNLRPCFETKVDRSAFPIQSANSAIEIAIDRTHIAGPDAAVSFCEIELELKRGASSELARIARRIASEVPAALALKTKAERGFALLQSEPPGPHAGDAVSLDPTTRVGEAFQAIGWSCLRHFVLNGDAVSDSDPRGVHQMRVGLRRLRAAISVFKRMLDGPETDAIKAELSWLTEELGPARELDVFLEATLNPMRAMHGDRAALSALCDDVAARRGVALDRAKAAVASDRYRQLVLRTALWLIAMEWSDSGELAYEQPSRRIGRFARRALVKRTRRAISQLRGLSGLDERSRRKLRIDLKTIRYATEFFEGVSGQSRRRRAAFLAQLEVIERDMGRLNDIEVQERLHDEFMTSWTTEQALGDPQTAGKAFAMGYVLGQQQQERAARISAAERGGRRLAALAPFRD